MTRPFVLIRTDRDRDRAHAYVAKAPLGMRVEFVVGDIRTLDQNRLMWPLLNTISRKQDWPKGSGVYLSADDWKIMSLTALGQEMRIVPNLDMTGFVNLGRSSSRLTKAEFSDLIEIIHAFAARNNIPLEREKVDA